MTKNPPESPDGITAPIIFVEDHCTDEDRDVILRGLVDYNESQAPDSKSRDIAVLARHEGKVVAGLTGHTYWNWLFVKWLWVAEDFRKQGLGRKLIAAAHQEARARGCQHAHLDAFDFQALPFYESLGYVVFGKLEDCPPGHTRFFLQKRDLDREA